MTKFRWTMEIRTDPDVSVEFSLLVHRTSPWGIGAPETKRPSSKSPETSYSWTTAGGGDVPMTGAGGEGGVGCSGVLEFVSSRSSLSTVKVVSPAISSTKERPQAVPKPNSSPLKYSPGTDTLQVQNSVGSSLSGIKPSPSSVVTVTRPLPSTPSTNPADSAAADSCTESTLNVMPSLVSTKKLTAVKLESL